MAKEIMDRRASDNVYLHRDFHGALSTGIDYLHERFGEEAVREYLRRFTRSYYAPLRERVKEEGLTALKRHFERLYETDPDRCCDILKVKPTRQAIEQLGVDCWVTGLRCTEGRTRTDFREVEERDQGLIKLNPILIWHERDIWQYLALRQVPVNPLYTEGYRSLGCAPCSKITSGGDERAGRWIGTSKCGGECGIHTRPLIGPQN